MRAYRRRTTIARSPTAEATRRVDPLPHGSWKAALIQAPGRTFSLPREDAFLSH
jgi:hypothetical protein